MDCHIRRLQVAGESRGVEQRAGEPVVLNSGPDPGQPLRIRAARNGDDAELDALAKGFRERTKREDERFRLATDSEYWFAVCFKSRADKDAFLAAARLMPVGDKYLDGYAVARTLGIEMPTNEDKE